MFAGRIVLSIITGAAVFSTAMAQQPPAAPRICNTVKQKLAQGRQVVGATVLVSEPEMFCAVAQSRFDFLWIEMQHSPLTYQDVARMIMACKGSKAVEFRSRMAWEHEGAPLCLCVLLH